MFSKAGFLAAQDLPVEHGTARAETKVLDLARDASGAPLEKSLHQPLPEEYIWTASLAAEASGSSIIYQFPGTMEQTEHHYFRHAFDLAEVPKEATLYVAGPRWEKVWINGQLADEVSSDLSSPLGMHVFTTSVAKYLKRGKNVIALEIVRGRGVTGFANSALVRQQTFGQVVVAKILPAGRGVDAKPIMISDASWKSSLKVPVAWEQPNFSETGWQPVRSIGGIESSIELYQWNADAGLYDWPGYDGISPFLAHKPVSVAEIKASYEGRSRFEDTKALTGGTGEFTVHFMPDAEIGRAHV